MGGICDFGIWMRVSRGMAAWGAGSGRRLRVGVRVRLGFVGGMGLTRTRTPTRNRLGAWRLAAAHNMGPRRVAYDRRSAGFYSPVQFVLTQVVAHFQQDSLPGERPRSARMTRMGTWELAANRCSMSQYGESRPLFFAAFVLACGGREGGFVYKRKWREQVRRIKSSSVRIESRVRQWR